jgi:hypothetical protein
MEVVDDQRHRRVLGRHHRRKPQQEDAFGSQAVTRSRELGLLDG